ncbi:MAG: GumC family protein [Acidobacteriia bacterium]|nr:GumC family protein [Terriglobia bacterium]
METYSIQPRAIRRSPDTAREILAILFRHRRLLVVSFFATFVAAVVATVLFGIRYEAQTEVLVRHQRADSLISADAGPGGHDAIPTDREINSEVALLQSDDLLQQVVQRTGLDSQAVNPLTKWIPDWSSPQERTAKAVKKLQDHLRITPVPQSNVIDLSYVSRDPEQAARVLREFTSAYLAKHVEVNKPPGVFDFFHTQTQQYADQLGSAEAQLASFIREQNAVAPTVARDLVLKQAVDFEGAWQQTQADIAQSARQVEALERQLAQVPPRYRTQEKVADNPQLMADLKSTLSGLELKRADLLTKYAPTYQLVQDADQQIAKIRKQIAGEEKSPIREEMTDSNPTYLVLEQELKKAKAESKSLQARAAATAPLAGAYGRKALLLDEQNLKLQDLTRAVKVAEDNYLLYNNKQEEARITDALDNKRILNVAVTETPSVPALPTTSPLELAMAGFVLAMMVGVGSAFTADYFDPSFRTPDEVVKSLDVPVLAALPSAHRDPMFALIPGNGNGHGRRWLFRRGHSQKALLGSMPRNGY